MAVELATPDGANAEQTTMNRLRIGGFSTLLVFLAASLAQAQTIKSRTQATGPRGRTLQRQAQVEHRPGLGAREVQVQRPAGTYDRSVQIQQGPRGAERDIRIQRPGGAVYERQVQVERRPGMVEHDVRIQRPGGATFDREVRVERGWGGGYGGYGPVMRGGYGREVIVERPVIVEEVLPPVAVAAPFFGLFLGGGAGGDTSPLRRPRSTPFLRLRERSSPSPLNPTPARWPPSRSSSTPSPRPLPVSAAATTTAAAMPPCSSAEWVMPAPSPPSWTG